jgi:predicted AlkP superfamily phosphohydrolase/phosphomutase
LLKIVNARFNGTTESIGGGRSRSLIPWLRQNLPPGVQNAIARMVTTQARDSVMNHSIIDGHDWTRTPALAVLADLSGYVRFSIRGREKQGMLDGGDAVRTYGEELIGALRSYRLLDGTPLVRDVIASSTMFSGQRSSLLPDLIVKWTPAPLAAEVQSDTLPSVRSQPITTRVGNHRPDGFCIELSPDIQHGATAEAKPIWELAAHACQSLLPASAL